MEGRVDAHVGRETETDSGGTYNRVNGVGATETGREFLGHSLQRDVLSREPDFLTRCVLGSRAPSPVSEAFVLCCCPAESLGSGVPDALTSANVVSDCGHSNFFLVKREQRRLITQGCFEGRQTSGRRDVSIVGIFHPRQKLTPVSRVGGSEVTKGCLKFLVHPFRLAIRLRMKTRS
ncbi:hypothetical protein AMECASPLE_019720 [Ameca splendens]|uniref:Uncharacterized protein n=1 Tax=Ameca splendens TaxID=208324 RepID=A0ABV0XG42_9TELE